MKDRKVTNTFYDQDGVNAVHDQINEYYAWTDDVHKQQTTQSPQKQSDLDGEQLT